MTGSHACHPKSINNFRSSAKQHANAPIHGCWAAGQADQAQPNLKRTHLPMIVRLLGAKSDPPGALLQVNA
jgi:hypothetical protein